MKRFTSLVAVLGVFTSFSTAFATDYTWDANGTSPGFFNAGGFADGKWGPNGGDATQLRWTTDPAGLTAPVAWTDLAADKAIFSVDGASGDDGNDPSTSDPDAVITFDTALTRTVNAITIGSPTAFTPTATNQTNTWLQFSGGGNVQVGAGGVTLNNYARLNFESTGTPSAPAYSGILRLGTISTDTVASVGTTMTIKNGGYFSIANIANMTGPGTGPAGPPASLANTVSSTIILDGGTFNQSNPGIGGTFLNANIGVQIAANTGVGYLSVSDPGDTGSIYTPVTANGAGIFGEGGTITNGGRQTLVKKGGGELRIGAAGNFTFAKLVVDGTGITTDKLTKSITADAATTTALAPIINTGEYRIANATDENAWGAIPLAPLADAIVLKNGGMLGTSQVPITLHPNRGIVISNANDVAGALEGGGGSWNTGGGQILISGVLSGSGDLIMGGTSGTGGGFTLNNPNNTFSGKIIMRVGTLNLNQNQSTPQISGVSANYVAATSTQTSFGTISIAGGKTLTVGTNGSNSDDADYMGRVNGSGGTFTKNGTGTIRMTGAEWTNLGTVNINAGSIQFGTGNANAGFGTYTTINIASGANMDMNGITDTYGGLNGAGNVINHNGAPNNATNDSSNLNLRGYGTYNLSGTISGTGEVVKNGIGTQTFSAPGGNSYGNGTRVYSGKLYVTNTSGSGTGSGPVQVGTTGTFGAINIDPTSTLGGTGLIDGQITVQLGGHLIGGTGGAPTGTFLTANSASTTDVQAGGSLDAMLGAPGNSDHVRVMLANGLNIAPGALFTLQGASSAINGPYTVLEHNGHFGASSVANLDVNNATGFDMSGGITDTGTAFTVNMTNTVQNRTWAASPATSNWSAAAADQANFTGGTGGQANGPGAIVSFGASSNHTVTITDSNKTVGSLTFNDATSYTVGNNINLYRLVMDTYSGDAAINLTSGNHAISAAVDTNKNTVVTNGGNTLTMSGGLYNKAGLVNSGSGTLEMTVDTSAKQIVNNADLVNSGTSNMTITMSTNATGGGFVNNPTGRVLNSSSGSLTLTNNGTANTQMINNGTFENSGTGTFTIAAGAFGLTGAITATDTVQNPSVIANYINSNANGTFVGNAAMANAYGMRFSNLSNNTSGPGSMIISGIITGGVGLGEAGNIYIDGPGTVVFSGANTHTGRTIFKQGKLQIAADNGLGLAPTITGGNYDNMTFDGGTLKTAPAAALTINANRGMYVKTTGTIETAGVLGTNDVTFAGKVHGDAGTTLTKTGDTKLTLSGESITNNGNIVVADGVLAVTLANALGTTTGNTSVTSGATLQTSGTVTIAEPMTLNGTGDAGVGALHHLSSNKTLSGPITLGSSGVRIQGDANTLTLSGAISGAGNPNLTLGGAGAITVSTGGINLGTGSLTKDGAGTLTLSRAAGNTMGGSLISAGRLNVTNTSNSGLGSGPVNVTGGTLGGTGSVTGAVSVNAGGTISPGLVNTANKLGTGPLTFNTGAYAADFSSTAALASAMDIINANGGLSIVPTSTLSLTDLVTSTAIAPGTKFTLISYSGAWDGGIFAGLPDDTGTIVNGLNTFKINYNDPTGGANFSGGLYANHVTLTVPSANPPGDWNGNGKVSLADYVTWRKDPPSFGGNEGANPSGYVTWRENFDVTAGSGAGLDGAAVPEPSSIALVLLGIAGLAGRRRTR